jgi:UDP-N-acetylglucosamine 2-epimerase (non-hydrolysing)
MSVGVPRAEGGVLLVVGTRPEAIKLAPVAMELSRRGIPSRCLLTGQHDTNELGSLLRRIGVNHSQVRSGADRQHRSGLAARFVDIQRVIHDELDVSDWRCIVVQGDTSSTLAGAITGFLSGVPVAHVEAGLRTFDLSRPFPEEGVRQLVARVATVHLAPTELAASHLMREGIGRELIRVTGNTGLDALRLLRSASPPSVAEPGLLVLTMHRRESWGAGMARTLAAIRDFVSTRADLRLTAVSHPNPAVDRAMRGALSGVSNCRVVSPLPYESMVDLLASASVVLTDSGGIQEEGHAMGIPLVILREETERPEVLDGGLAALSGTSGESVVAALISMLETSPSLVGQFRETRLGDGFASARCVDALSQVLESSGPTAGNPLGPGITAAQ